MSTLRERFLGSASGWRAFKVAIRSDSVMKVIAGQYVRPNSRERILDIGCGYGDLAAHVLDASYVGIDSNDRYIAYAQHHYGANCRFEVGDITKLSADHLGTFDCVVALGVLHHLNDLSATETLRVVSKMIRPHGRFLAMEPVWDPDQQTLARVLLALDRGRFIREQLRYEELITPFFANTMFEIRHDLTWFPYSHCLVTATL